MSESYDFKIWVEKHVSFGEGLSEECLKEWQKYLKAKENSFPEEILVEGSLEIDEKLPRDDFEFWLKRAFKRDHAQAATYDPVKDELIGHKIFWHKVGSSPEEEEALLPLTPTGHHRALFLDRDGIINVDGGYIHKVEDVSFVAGIEKIIALANSLELKVVVLTNQSGIGRGYYREDEVLMLHQWMGSELQKKGAKVDAWYYSPFHPDAEEERYKKASYTRKPMPGMALLAAMDHSLNIEKSFMIGDKVSDVLAQVDIPTFLLKGNYPLGNYPNSFNSLQEILERLTVVFR